MTTSSPSQTTLTDELRAVTRDRIVQGARRAMALGGFSVTADDLASAAGVSRRTLFRYFPAVDDLFAAGISAMRADFARALPTRLPEGELDAWLTDTLTALYRLSRDVFGMAFWDAHAVAKRDHSPPLKRAAAEAVGRRRGMAEQLAMLAWRAKAAPGEPPPWLVDTISLLASAFATNGFASGGLSLEESVRVAVHALTACIDAAVAEQQEAVS